MEQNQQTGVARRVITPSFCRLQAATDRIEEQQLADARSNLVEEVLDEESGAQLGDILNGHSSETQARLLTALRRAVKPEAQIEARVNLMDYLRGLVEAAIDAQPQVIEDRAAADRQDALS